VNDISIRPARAEDLDRIVAIMCDDPKPELRRVLADPERAKRVDAILVRNGLEIEVRCAVLAVLGGEAVGLLERQRPGETWSPSVIAILRALLGAVRIAGPGAVAKFIRYQRCRGGVEIKAPKDAYYVGELDVHPDFRNRGIGARLMAHAEEEARAEHFARMALTTTITNPARHLYERQGFHIVETRRDASYERMTGIPGRVLMVKELQ
jgi:ribosomal protein S18 acetylase RimI-like enzyme